MIQRETKFFADPNDSGLDADSAPFAVSKNNIVNSENIRWGTTDAGVTNVVESIGSTILKSAVQPSITFLTIGTAEDAEGQRHINFKCCTTGPWHRIVCYYPQTDTEYVVVLSSQVEEGLNFDKNYLIHSARVVNGLLYWTDNLNRQRKINIDKGIKLNDPSFPVVVEAYTAPISQEVLSVLKAPPLYPISLSKATQPSINNFVKTFSGEFAWAYYYKDGETSVLSTYSSLANYGYSADTSNRIDLVFPINENIDQDVQRVDLVVRTGNTNNFVRLYSWDKSNPVQAAQIASHNAGTTALTYAFYNDKGGETLDPAYAIKPFDSVPRKSESLEVAKNRLYLANNLVGYDTPQIASALDAEFITTEEGGTVSGTWWQLRWGPGMGSPNFYHVIYIGNIGGFSGYYGYLPYPGPTNPASIPGLGSVDYLTQVAFIGTSYIDVLLYFSVSFAQYQGFVQLALTSTIINPPTTTSLIGTTVFKSDAPYQIGIVFYDFGDRKCGVVTTNDLIFTTPDREFDSIAFTTSLNWSLSNNNALNEIPDWATHYSIVITKCLRTRYFLQAREKNITYATKDTDGLYVFNTAAYAANLNGVAIDITLLNGYGMGYVFADGDFVKIYIDAIATVYTLAIIAQDGNWIVCELQDLGTLGNTGTPKTDCLFEIYTPYKPSVTEPFYECGQTFSILLPGTSSRLYSTTSGSIGGDVTILNRGDGIDSYLTENMSPNDKFYKIWNTNSGRTNFVTLIGEATETHTIAYSNTYIAGSRINGLSSFEALNTKAIPLECGDIQKLQVTSKVQDEQGIVMLCICIDQTASLYIEEVQQYGSNKDTTLTIFADVIGTINVLKGNYGTVNPESVTEFRGLVFYLDANNGKYIMYSINGLFPISNYKMTRFWKQFSDQYLSMSVEQIEALGSRPFVFSTVDPHHSELLISIPKLLDVPPKGFLPDYPDTVYPFDIWDGQGKTIVFKIDIGAGYQPHWQGAYSFNPEYFVTLLDNLYSFQHGSNYLHNDEISFNNFYGVQYTSKIMCVANGQPNVPKVYDAVAVESNLRPLFFYFYNYYPHQQASDLTDISFYDKEGVWYSPILRNKLIPTATGFVTTGLLGGEKMRNVAMLAMIEFESTDVQLNLMFLTFMFSFSRGHRL